MLRLVPSLAGLIGLFPAAACAQQAAALPGVSAYHLATRWKPGGDGGWGDLTLDSQSHRLYVVRTDSVQIFDTERGVLVHTIPGLDGGHGVALAPELNRGFATSGGSGTVLVFDLTSLRAYGAPVAVGKNPGAVVYEPSTRHVFVFNREGGDASVIDAATAAVVATIPLGGTPKSAVSDERGSLFVCLEDKSEVLALDGQTNKITHRWPLAPGAAPTGLALNVVKHRLFAGCRNGRMIVLDASTGRILAELPIGQGVGACAVDPGAGSAFASCGDGTLTVVHEDPAGSGGYRVADTIKTPRGARTMALDPGTHAVYLAVASFETAPASTANDESPAPESVPGSFALLEFTPY